MEAGVSTIGGREAMGPILAFGVEVTSLHYEVDSVPWPLVGVEGRPVSDKWQVWGGRYHGRA